MKKLFTLLALTIGFSMNAQGYQYSTTVANWGSAFGGETTANGWHSFAINYQSQATNNNTFASGYQSVASGDTSTALGFLSQASGLRAVAIGSYTTASNTVSVAIGHNVTASGLHSVGLGINTNATGSYSTAIGATTTASGSLSTAMGHETIASDYGSLVIGQYNSSGSSVTNNAAAFNTANTAFVIGNGTASNAKSDAFKVMFNGDTTVSNDLTVNGDVNISSDARLKSNIVSLGSTLPKLLQIDGKSYEMKGKQKIGVLAQEIQEVFPELVSEDDNEMLAVNYQGLVPVLINALKEQDAKMKEQQSEIETYRDEVSELKEMVQELASRD